MTTTFTLRLTKSPYMLSKTYKIFAALRYFAAFATLVVRIPKLLAAHSLLEVYILVLSLTRFRLS